MLLLSDPSMLTIPVMDCGEDLVDVRSVPELALDLRKEAPDGAFAMLRSGVVERLLSAQRALPSGVRLLVVEGHRPVALQRYYFEGYSEDLAQAHPDWTPKEVFTEASKHVSPPAVAPHPCGAAVDLTLTLDGLELDLGTPINATPEASAGACFTAAENISAEARRWREVLGGALASVGFVNYPPEWWHWSYGDRHWAAVTGAANALYAPR